MSAFRALTVPLLALTLALAACGGNDPAPAGNPSPAVAPAIAGAAAGTAAGSAVGSAGASSGPPAASLPPGPPPRSAPAAYDNTHALEILRVLVVDIGPRVQGTDHERAAADYLAEQFSAFGYAVEMQPFPITVLLPGEVEFTAAGEPVAASAFLRSGAGVAEGPLIAVPGLGAAEDYAGRDLRGAVALVERGVLLFQEKVAAAAEAGAAAVVIYNNVAGPFDGALNSAAPIPALAISREDGLRLRQRAADGPVDVRVHVEGGAVTGESRNVIARTPGQDCRIYVGGHYDSVPDIPGANDNASGTALVLALARAYAGAPGADGVCFVAFGAEESGVASGGLQGSAALVASLQDSNRAGDVAAMLDLDVAAAGQSIILVGTPALTGMGVRLATALGIPAVAGALPPGTGSDYLPFQAAGIPVLFPTVLGGPIHTVADAIDAVDPARLAQMGRLAHALLGCLIRVAGGGAPDACPAPGE